MTFGRKLKELRRARGFTQQELANKVGVAKSTLAGYEIDNREPYIDVIKKISIALEVSTDELLCIERVPGILSPSAELVGGCFDIAPEHVQRAVMAMLEPYDAAKSLYKSEFIKHRNNNEEYSEEFAPIFTF